MRRPFLSFLLAILPLVAAATACGGKTTGPGPEPGPTSSSGASASSSGAATSGGGASSSSSSSGAPGVCPTGMIVAGSACSTPDLACSYCDEITEINCTCSSGEWACLDDGPACPAPACPDSAPQAGSACGPTPYSCSWPTMEGCGGEACSCDGGTWSCAAISCPAPPPCPTQAPAQMSTCPSVGQTCTYDTPYCGGAQEPCECEPSGNWFCDFPDCAVDAGSAPDAQ